MEAMTLLEFDKGGRAMEFSHRPVMLAETLGALYPSGWRLYRWDRRRRRAFSRHFGSPSQNGRLLMIDQDPDAIETLQERFRAARTY